MTNDITISGNLTKEPIQRFTPNGKSVVEFTLAHNTRQYNQQSQQWEDGEPCFIDVTFWGKKGENFLQDYTCLLYTSPSPRDLSTSRMPSSA